MGSSSLSALANCLRPYLNMALVMPLNRLRDLGSKFFTIAAGRKRKSSIFSLPRKIIVIFNLNSVMIVLSLVMSPTTGFVVQRMARPIWQCVARYYWFLDIQSPSWRSVRATSFSVILVHTCVPFYFG